MSSSSGYWRRPRLPHSKVKSAIVGKYFKIWSNVLKYRSEKLVYLDLYAGKGRHDNGEPSTAMRILGMASADKTLREKLVVYLNDVKPTYVMDMENVVEELGYRKQLSQEINISNAKVDHELANRLVDFRFAPTFCFIDPYGFKGLSLKLIRAVTKDWGCDCLLFFHTSGINRNLFISKSEDDIRSIFGDQRFNRMKKTMKPKSRYRQLTLLNEFRDAVTKEGCKHFLAHRFNFDNSSNISHHLILLTKSDLGFRCGKDVMSKYSLLEDSIPNYTYSVGCEKSGDQGNLIGTGGPMNKLQDFLMERFAGGKLLVGKICDVYDSECGMCTGKNVKQALINLELSGQIQVDEPPAKRMRMGQITLGDKRMVSFLGRRN